MNIDSNILEIFILNCQGESDCGPEYAAAHRYVTKLSARPAAYL